MKDNGRMIKCMDKENMCLMINHIMKGIGKMINNMDKELKSMLKIRQNMQGNMLMELKKVLVVMNGEMDQFILVNLKMECKMVKVNIFGQMDQNMKDIG